MSLQNLKSIFEDEIRQRTEDYISNNVTNVANTNLNYNENNTIPQTHGFDVSTSTRSGRDNPILDSLLRGRVYTPIRFSQDIIERNLFVLPERGDVENQLYKTQTFDPRASTPKQDTLYFNTGNSFVPASNPTDFSSAGKQGEPFTPLNTLTDTFIEGLSWEKLYNKNHTPKSFETAGHMGLKPISYPNVDRSKLDIHNNQPGNISNFGRTSFLSGVGNLLSFFSLDNLAENLQLNKGGEPYIVSNISKSSSDMSGGRLINFGGRDLPIAPMLTDAVRLSKYLTSPNGIAFIAKQNALALQTPNRKFTKLGRFSIKQNIAQKKFYNPLSTIIAAGFRAGGVSVSQIDKTQPGISDLIGADTYPNFNKYSDEYFQPPLNIGGVTIEGSGSPMATYLKFNFGTNSFGAQNNIFLSDLPTSDKNPIRGNAYSDGGSQGFGTGRTAPPYPDYNKFDEDIGKGSPLKKLREKTEDLQLRYSEDYMPAESPKHKLNDTYYSGKVFGDDDADVQVDAKSLLSKYEDGKARGDVHTLMQFGVSNDEVSSRLGRNEYFDKIEDAHPNDSKNGNILGRKSGMPLYFKDMRDKAFIFFRAYIDGLTETVTPSYTGHNFMGRSEPVYVYERADRSISFNLKLFAQTKRELSAIYEKMNKLTSLCYPEYLQDTLPASQIYTTTENFDSTRSYGNRMKPPFVKMRMGELYGNTNAELMGYFESLTYTVENSPWETEVGKRVPKYIQAAITFKVIHAKAPNMNTRFYGYTGDGSMAGTFEYIAPPEPPQTIQNATGLTDEELTRVTEEPPAYEQSELVQTIGEVIDEYVPESIQKFARDTSNWIEEKTGIDLNPFDDDGIDLWPFD